MPGLYFIIAFVAGGVAAGYLMALPYWICKVNGKEIEWLTPRAFEKRHFRVIPKLILFTILYLLTAVCLFAWFAPHFYWFYGKSDLMVYVNGFFFPIIVFVGSSIVTALFEIHSGVTLTLGGRGAGSWAYCSLPPNVRRIGQCRALVSIGVIVLYSAVDYAAKCFLKL